MIKAIRNIFSEIPETYELVNHILTFGLDILWRKRAVNIAVKSGGNRWIDVCTGTGETASYLCRFAKNGTKVYAADFSLPMLRKAKEKPEGGCIKFLLSDVENLPFSDNTFDLITISFATRNINRNQNILIRTFKEFHRILKINGHFVNLETSHYINMGKSFFRGSFISSVRYMLLAWITFNLCSWQGMSGIKGGIIFEISLLYLFVSENRYL